MPVAKQIIDEQSTHYLVDWEDDIITGTKYHSSWVIKLAISPEMIQAWEQVKVANCATEQDHRAQQTDLGLMNFNGQSFPYQPHWDPYSASQMGPADSLSEPRAAPRPYRYSDPIPAQIVRKTSPAPDELLNVVRQMQMLPSNRTHGSGRPVGQRFLGTFPDHIKNSTRCLKENSRLHQYTPEQLGVSEAFWKYLIEEIPVPPGFLPVSGPGASEKATLGNASRQQQPLVCNQLLLDGFGTMTYHWGPVHPCQLHRGNFNVCHSCREAYLHRGMYAYEATGAVRSGAKVPLCNMCAEGAVHKYGRGVRACKCDTAWSCYECRMTELAKLVKAKSQHQEGYCPCRTGNQADEFNEVKYCLCCRKFTTPEMVGFGY